MFNRSETSNGFLLLLDHFGSPRLASNTLHHVLRPYLFKFIFSKGALHPGRASPKAAHTPITPTGLLPACAPPPPQHSFAGPPSSQARSVHYLYHMFWRLILKCYPSVTFCPSHWTLIVGNSILLYLFFFSRWCERY